MFSTCAMILASAPFARAAVAAKRPARADRGVKTVRSGGGEVGNPDVIIVFSEPVHLVLRHAKLEIFWQFDAEADGALKRNPSHRRGVFELRHIIAKRKSGSEEQK